MEILKSCQCITILDWLSEHAGVKIYLIFESRQISLWLCTVRGGHWRRRTDGCDSDTVKLPGGPAGKVHYLTCTMLTHETSL